MTQTPQMKPLLDLVVLDCPQPRELAAFYSQILGWPIEEGSSDDFVTLTPSRDPGDTDRPAGRISLAFQQVEDYQPPTWPEGPRPQHFHLDLAVSDLDAAEPAVLGAGATRHEHQPSENGSFRVYLDPAGHPFCLVS
ncbi:VOC family protein [Pedococcus sp. 5OH_020]|uniref:VOC family protein n=1 Tax=Pedococcus sp. 5OH_020 TaxID=2989814 RepID=UPI0022E9CBEF|nr:VOC family protein [Pedococcus sp. 5OH_020]